MLVREINDNFVGRAVVLIEADNFPFYNGLIGTVGKDEKMGFYFNPALKSMQRQGKTFHMIPLKPYDLIEPLY